MDNNELSANLAEVGTDCISRQAAISAICNACGKIDCDKMDKCEKLQLPPANCSEFPNNSDTISRQVAIDAVRMVIGDNRSISVCDAIKQLPPIHPVNNSEMPNSSDVISRQAAIDALASMYCKSDEDGYVWIIRRDAWARIDSLPPAEPKRGKWIRDGHHIRCDQCGMHICDTDREGDRIPTEFCPNCGAKMEVNHESN